MELRCCIQDPSHVFIGLGPKRGCFPAGVPCRPVGAQEVHRPANWLGQLLICIFIRLGIGEGVFLLWTYGVILRVLIATAILGKLILLKVGVILIEFRALLAVWLFIGLPFFF